MSDYGSVIGGVIGAVVGYFAGGNVYAGWTIGSAIGGAYSASQQVLPGPKIGDLAKQSAQEGGFRPIVYGRSVPMPGNMIADSDPKIVKKEESQGKGGPKVETEYAYRTYAVGFCEGEAELLQVWKNQILVYDAEDPSMGPENTKFREYATWYSGAFDQNADPDLEGVYGVGNAPFFRGTAYLVLANEDVTDQRGAWSQWQVRVFRGAAKRLTTPPYPLEVIEAVGAISDAASGFMWEGPRDGFSVGSDIVSGELRDLLRTYAVAPEGFSVESDIVEGDLRDILRTYEAPPEGFSTSSDIVSGELKGGLIEYDNYPIEGIEMTSDITSGTLE